MGELHGKCSFCSLACPLVLGGVGREPIFTAGSILALDWDKASDSKYGGSLCARGNAVVEFVTHPNRLNYPFVLGERSTFGAAVKEAAKNLSAVKEESGSDSIGVLIGDNLTNEEAALSISAYIKERKGARPTPPPTTRTSLPSSLSIGKGYPMDKLEGKEVLVVGGGVGLAPLRSLIYALIENASKYKRISIKYGARLPEELCFRRQYEEWGKVSPNVDFTNTIDVPAPGWTGRVGLVTTLLEDLDIDIKGGIAISCGPEIMLKFVTLKLLEVGYKPLQIYLSMNRKMSCGMGKCGRCSVGHYYLCVDGPDMCYENIKHVPNVFG